jgi:transcriptional regulator with GAF, ATPase, and Fis domain
MALGPAALELEHFLPDTMRLDLEPPTRPPAQAGAADLSRCDELQRDLIWDALERHGSYRRAARALRMSKSTLADRARRFGVQWRKK